MTKKNIRYITRIEKKVNNKNKNNKKKEFYFKWENGSNITNKNILDYVSHIRIPPAYTNVKINPDKNAELSVTGYDVAGRKQYLYSQAHWDKKDRAKFCNLIKFGNNLPKIRKKYNDYLVSTRDSKNRMISLILKIIDICNFRIGTDKCTQAHKHFGISTLHKEHIKIKSSRLAIIDFVGKKAVQNTCSITDPKLVDILEHIRNNASNSNKIFSYKDAKKKKKVEITFLDINKFLGEYGNFTSKVFRTWAANKLLIDELKHMDIEEKVTKRKKQLREALKVVAEKLHHTPAICKAKYLCPQLLDMFVDNPEKFNKIIINNKENKKGLSQCENDFMSFLKHYDNKYCKNVNKYNIE